MDSRIIPTSLKDPFLEAVEQQSQAIRDGQEPVEMDGHALADERKRLQRERRLKEEKYRIWIVRLHTQGYSVREIAEMMTKDGMPVGKSWVSIVINKMHKAIREEQKRSMEHHVSSLLAENRTVRRESWGAWERSKKEMKKTSIKKRGGVIEETGHQYTAQTESKIERTERVGDAKFLNIIQEGMAEEARLLGIYTSMKEVEKKNAYAMTSEDRKAEIMEIMRDVELGADRFVADLKAGAFESPAVGGEGGTEQAEV